MSTRLSPVLSALYRYPLKSGQAERLTDSIVSPQGLPFDREWMVASADGEFITGRRYPQLVLVRAEPGPDGVRLSAPGRDPLFVANSAFQDELETTVWRDRFAARCGATEADAWISDYLGVPLRFVWLGAASQRRVRAEPAVPLTFADGFPLLLIGQASLDDLSSRVGRALSMAQFRTNLVVSGSAPFAEDGWKRIRIGEVLFRLVKPCERCVFTTVDPLSGVKSADQEPLRTLAAYRNSPDGVIFGQNVIAENVGKLTLGMDVEVLE